MTRTRSCYQDALEALVAGTCDMEGATTYLCHGFPHLTKPDRGHPAGTMYGHAWLEIELPLALRNTSAVICINLLGEHMLPRDLYYAFGQIDPATVTRYTCKEAITTALEAGHHGPWVDGPPEAVYARQ